MVDAYHAAQLQGGLNVEYGVVGRRRLDRKAAREAASNREIASQRLPR